MSTTSKQVPYDSPNWGSLPSSIPQDRNPKDCVGLLFRANHGDWKVTPSKTQIDGPTWGFWRKPEAEEFEVTTEVQLSGGNYLT